MVGGDHPFQVVNLRFFEKEMITSNSVSIFSANYGVGLPNSEQARVPSESQDVEYLNLRFLEASVRF